MQIPFTATPFLWLYIKKYRLNFLALVICLLVWAVNEAVFPYFIKMMVDIVSGSLARGSIWMTFSYPIIGLASVWLLMEISMRLYGFIEIYLYPRFRASMRTEIFDYVKGQSSSYFVNNLAGSIGAKIADIPKSSQYILEHLLWHVIAILFVFVLSIIVVAQVNGLFSVLIIVWAAAHMGITFYFQSDINKKVAAHYESVAALNGETIDIITNATSMRLFARIKFETRRLDKFQGREIKQYIVAGWALFRVALIQGMMSLIFIFSTIYFLLKGWQEGWLTPGDFPLVAMSGFNLLGQIWHLSMSLVDMFRDIGTLNGALSILKTPYTIIEMPRAKPLVVHKGAIEFKEMGFGYHKDGPLFNNLSTTIPAGQKVGLVGFSGSGKTTFMNLILREYDCTSGHILIDGQDIKQVSLSSLREQISVIPQEPSLFHRSIIENIRYGRLEATDEEVIEAAKKALCHEFIEDMQEGYHTIIGERGLKLSGGQRQRLNIARAVLKDAPLLFLDEATSALDSATEKAIHNSLMALMENRTTVVIAHRLSTLKMMDRIIVFDKGQILEEGTPRQLLQRQGHFAHLWSLQQEGFLPEKEDT